MPKNLARTFNCPTEFTLAVLGGKWKTVILCYLKQRPLRYADLRTLAPQLSDKVLTERLQELVDVGLIARKSADGGRKGQVYYLTRKGLSLGTLLVDLYGWGRQHAAAFGVSVGLPLTKL